MKTTLLLATLCMFFASASIHCVPTNATLNDAKVTFFGVSDEDPRFITFTALGFVASTSGLYLLAKGIQKPFAQSKNITQTIQQTIHGIILSLTGFSLLATGIAAIVFSKDLIQEISRIKMDHALRH